MGKLISFIAILALYTLHANAAETFAFQSQTPPLEIEESTPATANTMLMIQRSGTQAEIALASMTTVSTACPAKVTATAAAADYAITTTVPFTAGVTVAPVSITVVDDTEEEFREFFCVTITTNPGISSTTEMVYIKGNDYCVNVNSVAEASDMVDMPDNANTAYIGPWCVGETGIPDTITMDITPEDTTPTGADDLYIFLTTNADKSNIGNFYGLYLDDSLALTTHLSGTSATPAAVADDSVIVKNGFGTPAGTGLLNDASVSGTNDIVNVNDNSFTLQYIRSTGAITLTDTGNSKSYTATDATAMVDVNHIFVASGNNEFAAWKFCGLLPRKLRIVGASASGNIGAYTPNNAFNNGRSTELSSGCFISDMQLDPWIRVDLGREFDVKMVLIWPAATVTTITAPTDLSNAKVYVGSCTALDFASIATNHECNGDIGAIGASQPLIEAKCDTSIKTYGRYVYIVKDTMVVARISLCEIEVYGDDIPIGEEAVVQFSTAAFPSVSESATSIPITATRTGMGLTCTNVDFYTDASSSSGFTAVPSNSPTTLSWIKTDATNTMKTVPGGVLINQDNVCEDSEIFNVYLTNAVGGKLGEQICSTVTITDDDSVVYALSSATYKATEGAAVQIGVTRTGNGVNQAGSAELIFTAGTAGTTDFTSMAAKVEFTSGGTSPQTTDIATDDDEAYEGDETFTVSLGSLVPSCSSKGTQETATVTISDNDSLFKFTSTSASITISEGTASTPIGISRTGTAKQKMLHVDVNTITATAATDFNIAGSPVTFLQSDSSESITVNVIDDSIVEADETFTLTLRDPLYSVGNRNLETYYRLTVTITNNDAKYSWKQTSYSTTEGVGSLQVQMVRSGDTSTAKTVTVTTTGTTATAGTDFTPISQVVFQANSAEATANIPISNNNIVESDESFTLTIVSGQQDVEVGSTATTTVTIADDDNEVKWQAPTYSFNENMRTNTVTLTKTGSGTVTVTVTSRQGTAMEGVDYEAISTRLTLSGSTQSLSVNLIDDETKETPDETFTLTVSGTGITSSSTTITIVDDDEDDGLGAGAIAGITVAAIVGAIALVAGVVVAFTMFSGGTAAATTATQAATQAQRAAAQRAVNAGALQTFPQNNFSGLNGLGNSGFNSYGNSGLTSLNSSLYPGLNQGFGNGLNQGFGTGLNNQGFGQGLYQL